MKTTKKGRDGRLARNRRRTAATAREIGRRDDTPCRTCGGPPALHSGMVLKHSYRPEIEAVDAHLSPDRHRTDDHPANAIEATR